jgi:hypothetical protein
MIILRFNLHLYLIHRLSAALTDVLPLHMRMFSAVGTAVAVLAVQVHTVSAEGALSAGHARDAAAAAEACERQGQGQRGHEGLLVAGERGITIY